MDEQPSVLLLSSGYPPEQLGGVEQHVRGLAHELRSRGSRVHVYTRGSLPDVPAGTLVTGESDGVPVTRVAYRWEGITRLRDLYRVRLLDDAFERFLAAEHFDVAHVHHLTGLSAGLLPVLRKAAIPTVMTLHDYWTICPRGQMFHRHEELCDDIEPLRCGACLAATWPFAMPAAGEAQRTGFFGEDVQDDATAAASLHAYARDLLELPELLLTPATAGKDVFARSGVPRSRIAVIPNGIDLSLLRDVPRTHDQKLRIGYLGTLIPSKGLHVLVEAFLALPRERVSLSIHGNAVPFHGDSGYLTRVFSAVPPGVSIRYEGAYRQADLPRILSHLDVVVVPALWNEAYGLTAREARAAGLPVVVSAIGGLTEGMVDGESCLVVPPGDAPALAAALRRFLDEPELGARMGAPMDGEGRGFGAMTGDLQRVYARLRSPWTDCGEAQPMGCVSLWSADLDGRAEVFSRDDASVGVSFFSWQEDLGRWGPQRDARQVFAQDRKLAVELAAKELERNGKPVAAAGRSSATREARHGA